MIGKSLAHYEIVELLGRGGMGEVYRAHDPRTGRDVAIKVLPPSFAEDVERLARFQREARLLAGLNHRNIATLYGVEEADGQPFLVMEYAAGQDLAQRLSKGALSLEDALDIALQLAEAIEEAHEAGVVHRDLKPANIMVDDDGLVKVLDFGLARAYVDGESVGEQELANSPTITAAMTAAGTVLGTAAYMSPEQARGRAVDRRSDLWSFGVILWEMLTGERLFEGETVSDTIAGVLKSAPPWERLPAETPHGVRRLLERCLERDVRNRLRDIGEARIRLQRWKSDPATLDQSFGTAELPVVRDLRPNWLPWAIAALAVAVAFFFGLRSNVGRSAGRESLVLELQLEGEKFISDNAYSALSLSPDGRYMLWTTDKGIYVRELSSLDRLYIPTPARVASAGFSPDSKWFAYSHSSKLFRQSVTGGPEIAICDVQAARGLDWVDDETIVMSRDYGAPLSLISVVDGSIRTLTELRSEERSHRWPCVVRGAGEVLFTTQYPGRDYDASDIEAVSLADGTRRTIYRGGAFPRYAPTGHLLFARGTTIFAVPYSPGDPSATGVATPVLSGVETSIGDQEIDDGSVRYGFDADGTVVYGQASDAGYTRSQLAFLDLESGGVEPFGESGEYSGPSISPDGEALAVQRGFGSQSAIVVRELRTGAEQTISTTAGTKYLGSWSPDGGFVYWTQGNDAATEFQVLRAPRDGSEEPRPVYSSHHTVFVDGLSSDGRYLVLTSWSPENSYDIVRLDLDATEPTIETLMGGPGDQTGYKYSPDQRFALVVDGPTVDMNIFIRRNPDTGARWPVGNVKSDHLEMWWSAQGDAIFEVTERGLRRYSLTFSGQSVSVARPVLLHEPNWLMRTDIADVCVHPDGKRLLILVPEARSEVSEEPGVVWRTGWFEEVRRLTARN